MSTKLAGHIDVDDMDGHDLGALGYLATHVVLVCRSNHVQPRGTLTTQGLTSIFNDDRCIRWQLELDLEPCPMCGLPMHWRPEDGVWGCSWCIDGEVDLCDSRTTCDYCSHPHGSHMHNNPRRLCRDCMCTGYVPKLTTSTPG